eukprot:10230951-Alexandrium_andersonii.AAC.1
MQVHAHAHRHAHAHTLARIGTLVHPCVHARVRVRTPLGSRLASVLTNGFVPVAALASFYL